jgi:radical SAM protein with 4Fe4S-binding SPASM domain
MRPCNHAPLIAGDSVFQTIEQIWSGSVMNNWRSLIPNECRSCSSFTTCHGGCRAQALLDGQAKDPMIHECTVETQPILDKELYLDRRLRPIGQFVKHSEHSIEILIHKSQAVMIPFDHKDMLHTLNGDWSLGEIRQKYGDDMLNTIGVLYEKGMIAWANSQPIE